MLTRAQRLNCDPRSNTIHVRFTFETLHDAYTSTKSLGLPHFFFLGLVRRCGNCLTQNPHLLHSSWVRRHAKLSSSNRRKKKMKKISENDFSLNQIVSSETESKKKKENNGRQCDGTRRCERKKKLVTAIDDDIEVYALLRLPQTRSRDDNERTRKNLFVANLCHASTYTGNACHQKNEMWCALCILATEIVAVAAAATECKYFHLLYALFDANHRRHRHPSSSSSSIKENLLCLNL